MRAVAPLFKTAFKAIFSRSQIEKKRKEAKAKLNYAKAHNTHKGNWMINYDKYRKFRRNKLETMPIKWGKRFFGKMRDMFLRKALRREYKIK